MIQVGSVYSQWLLLFSFDQTALLVLEVRTTVARLVAHLGLMLVVTIG